MPISEPPTVAPHERDLAEVAPAEAYQPGAPVWVWNHNVGWRPGEVRGTGPLAVIVSYQPAAGRGEVTDTVMADRVALRNDRTDPVVERE